MPAFTLLIRRARILQPDSALINNGAIAPGYDIDLTVVDLHTHHSVRREDWLTTCGWSPFEG